MQNQMTNQKLRGYKAPVGVQAKPRSPDLKIRKMTDPEIAMSQWKSRYQKNGKTTWGGALRMIGDMASTSLKRIVGIDSYKKGGKVKKTGLALLHKGEIVMPKKKIVKEHKHLVKVLKSKKGLKKEAKKQEKELKEYKK